MQMKWYCCWGMTGPHAPELSKCLSSTYSHISTLIYSNRCIYLRDQGRTTLWCRNRLVRPSRILAHLLRRYLRLRESAYPYFGVWGQHVVLQRLTQTSSQSKIGRSHSFVRLGGYGLELSPQSSTGFILQQPGEI